MTRLAKFAVYLLAVFVLVCGAALLFSARPTPVLGYDGASLAHSVDHDNSAASCRKLKDGKWRCRVPSGSGGSQPTIYLVHTKWDGCWNGTRTGKVPATPTARKISGCVTIWDHLRLENIFNN